MHSPTPNRAERTAERQRIVRRRLRLALAAALATAAIAALVVGRPSSRSHAALLVTHEPDAGDSARIISEIPPAAEVGPSAWEDGVPVGWVPTRQGAVAAAAAYGKVLSSSWFLTDAARRDRALVAMATPGSLATLQTAQRELSAAVAARPLGSSRGRRVVSSVLTTSYLGYRLEQYREHDSARVVLWAVVVAGNDANLPPQALWGTSTLRLRWAGDWKLEDARTVPGPVPVYSQAEPSTPAELVAAIRGFEGFADVPAR
jgi:hypothetical protein